jgi:hypothetical protein
MRVLAALAAIMLLAGCDDQSGKPLPKDPSSQAAGAEAFANTGTGFDYRYAFRLPGDRLKAVLQSHADGCDKLGPARCRILAMRYRVSDGNQIKAVLTLTIDPAIARAYGDAAVKTLQSADGVLTDSEISGADATATARSQAIVNRLRERQKAAQALAAKGDLSSKTQADRIQIALDTIAESESGQGQTMATAPVLLTYESSNALTGLGNADANFRNAGQSLENSLARLAIVLGAIGPWLLALIGIILILRLIVHGTGRGNGNGNGNGEDYAENGHEDRQDERHDHRNLIQRWFNREEDAREPEHH